MARITLLLTCIICLTTALSAQTTLQQFAAEPFGNGVGLSDLKAELGKKLKVKEAKPVTNIHEPSVTDTIYKLKYKSSTFSWFKGHYNEFLLAADLKHKKTPLGYGLAIKMELNELKQALKGQNSSLKDGKLSYTLDDGNTLLQFHIKKDKLREITIEQNYVD